MARRCRIECIGQVLGPTKFGLQQQSTTEITVARQPSPSPTLVLIMGWGVAVATVPPVPYGTYTATGSGRWQDRTTSGTFCTPSGPVAVTI
jgi:hypothetical protein